MPDILKMKIRRPDDWHVHLREGCMLSDVVQHTARTYGRALVMPNLKAPVIDAEGAMRYCAEIEAICMEQEWNHFKPYMTIKLTQNTTPKDIEAIRKTANNARILAVKLYPEGATTNSHGGVSELGRLEDTLKAIQDAGLVLCVHGEDPHKFVLSREKEYLTRIEWILRLCPSLKIVLEHITTTDAVSFVKGHGPNLAATITAHHLHITLDDVVGGMISPHNFCKPIAKTPMDREDLQFAATNGDHKFFFGSDSAPHALGAKECSGGCAGCFTAPHAIELLAEVFDKRGAISKLEPFTSEFGARFYGLPLNEGQITLEQKEWTVPDSYAEVVPFMAGQTLHWYAE